MRKRRSGIFSRDNCNYFLIFATGSSISAGNSVAGLPVATSVIHVAYTIYGFDKVVTDEYAKKEPSVTNASICA